MLEYQHIIVNITQVNNAKNFMKSLHVSVQAFQSYLMHFWIWSNRSYQTCTGFDKYHIHVAHA